MCVLAVLLPQCLYRSDSSFLLQGLVADGAKTAIFDPKVTERQILADLSSSQFEWDHPRADAPVNSSSDSVDVYSDAYAACEDAHAICVLTEWEEFKHYDFERIFASMKKPAFLFDGYSSTL